MKYEEDFPVDIARNILFSAISAANNPSSAVNSKSNAVRCVSNILFYLTKDRLGGDEVFAKVMFAGAAYLLDNIKTVKIMKIRCYAAQKERTGKNTWIES